MTIIARNFQIMNTTQEIDEQRQEELEKLAERIKEQVIYADRLRQVFIDIRRANREKQAAALKYRQSIIDLHDRMPVIPSKEEISAMEDIRRQLESSHHQFLVKHQEDMVTRRAAARTLCEMLDDETSSELFGPATRNTSALESRLHYLDTVDELTDEIKTLNGYLKRAEERTTGSYLCIIQ